MKYTKITEQNIGLIYRRLIKFFERNEYVSSQTNWGSLPKLKNKLGLKPFKEIPNAKAIEVSNKSYLSLKNDEIDIILNNEIINASISIVNKNFMDWVQVGDWIKIDSKEMKLKATKFLADNESQKYLTTFKCANESDYNAYIQDMLFWHHASADWEENMSDEIFEEGVKRKLEENDKRLSFGVEQLDEIAKEGIKVEDVTKIIL